ncbi:MAG: hypothetical protein EAZ37_17200 [Burkholderiales bacterium]|nr:MAG: hypothetical protein EAZ43_08625 [Betaproteobacteria bacterium]TAG24083.1 MAG: hypothetical protein EAZ37_17200 [Burkholderiales bacterium]
MSAALKSSRYVGDVVFRRTIKGEFLIKYGSALHRSAPQRMLAALDGRRTANSLALAFRAREVVTLLKLLESKGLIESVGGVVELASITSVDAASGVRAPLALHELEAAKLAAIGAARELLGTSAKASIREIEQCRDTAMFRSAIDVICERLSSVLGADAAAIFVETTRRAGRV